MDDGRYLTRQVLLAQLQRLLLLNYQDRHILMGWHIHHMQPVTPREISVKQEVRASINHDMVIVVTRGYWASLHT
jgi:hypothetical protein